MDQDLMQIIKDETNDSIKKLKQLDHIFLNFDL